MRNLPVRFRTGGRSRFQESLRDSPRTLRSALSLLEIACLIGLAILIILTIVGPWIAPQATETANPTALLQPPSGAHWLGTDENGMDIMSRILAAPRTDVQIAFIATALSVLIGAPLGALAGFFEGGGRHVASFAGEAMMRLVDVVQAFPVFILAMVLVAIRGTSTVNIIGAVAFVNIPVFLRLARSEVLSLRQRPYTEAARIVGNSDLRIVFRHLLPNALPSLVVQVSVTVGFAILLTAGLSFVGAGVTPPTPELGAMIATGSQDLVLGKWWVSLFPGIALGLIVFVFAVSGEALGHLLIPGARAPRSGRRADSDAGAATVPTRASFTSKKLDSGPAL